MTQLLYGQPGDEHLDDDPATVVERWLDDHPQWACEECHEEWLPTSRTPSGQCRTCGNRTRERIIYDTWVIEEWSTRPPSSDLPDAAALVEWLSERVCEFGEVDEQWCEAWDTLLRGPGNGRTPAPIIAALVEGMLGVIGTIADDRLGYRMADKKLRELAVTHNPADPDNPLLDGEPTWHRPTP